MNKISWKDKILNFKDNKVGYEFLGIHTTYTDINGLNILLGNKVEDLSNSIGIVLFNPLWNDWMVDFSYGAIDGYSIHLTEEISKTLKVLQ
jgi:hypothetical protein